MQITLLFKAQLPLLFEHLAILNFIAVEGTRRGIQSKVSKRCEVVLLNMPAYELRGIEVFVEMHMTFKE